MPRSSSEGHGAALDGVPVEELVRALIAESPDGIVLVDGSGRVLLANPEMQRLSGYDDATLINQPVEILLLDAHRHTHRVHRDAFALDPASRPMGIGLDLAVRRRDGSSFPVEIALTPLDSPSGPLAMATVRDITERRAATETQAQLASLQAIADVVSLHRTLTTAVSVGRGLTGIAEAVRQVIGGTVVVDDLEGSRSARAGDPTIVLDGLPGWRHLSDPPHAQAFRDDDWLVAVACPEGEVLGAISMLDPDGVAGPAAAFALEQAATVLAMELFRLRSVAETELKVWGDLATELLDDDDPAHSRGHAVALGYNIDRQHRAILVERSGPGIGPLTAAVRRAARQLGLDASLVTSRAAGVVLLAADDVDWTELGRALNQQGHDTDRIGVGELHDTATLRQSVAEAELALRLSAADVVLFEELGIWRLLAADTDPARMHNFIDHWIGALVTYDSAHRSELVDTLAAFLKGQGALEAGAKSLHIHPSTFKYRLRRIRELSGWDLRDSDQRFSLELACRAHASLDALTAAR